MSETTTTERQGFFKDKEGRIALAQRPNLPIIAWAIFKVASMLVSQQHLKTGLAQLSTAFLFTWAYLEITQGVNYFRRTLGAIVMIAVIISFFR